MYHSTFVRTSGFLGYPFNFTFINIVTEKESEISHINKQLLSFDCTVESCFTVTFLKGPLLSVQPKLPYMFIFLKKTLFVHSPHWIWICSYNLYYFYFYTAMFIFLLLSFHVLFKFLFKEFNVHSRCVLKNSCLG